MVGVSDLDNAQPGKWRQAASDLLTAARHCDDLSSTAREEVAVTLKMCWNDETGKKARRKFVKQADALEAAADTLRGLAKVYDTLADDMEAAQRDLHSALDYARRHDLEVDESGRVGPKNPVFRAPNAKNPHIEHVTPIVDEALRKAGKADTEAEAMIRSIQGLVEVTDPKPARDVPAHGPSSPIAIALRLHATRGSLHRINVGPSQLDAVDRAVAETKISKRLLLAILWQEQQWYQKKWDSDLSGPIPFLGRLFNWTLRETLVPDKSLGITHMKLDTVREVMHTYEDKFKFADGRILGDLSDSQLSKYIEERPNEAIRLSAYYLKRLRSNPYGAETDKQLFLLYAADTEQVRDANAEFGDSTEERDNAIGQRARNWDELQAPLDDALAWDALTKAQQQQALEWLEAHLPDEGDNDVEPIYTEDRPEPKPSPGPPPTPSG